MIQPATTRTNVANIPTISLLFVRWSPETIIGLYFLFHPIKIPDNQQYRIIPPQTTKVQLAPCHNPLIKNTISVFRAARHFEHLLPPIGI